MNLLPPTAAPRSPAQVLALGAAWVWGLVEFLALARRRWLSRRAR